MAYIEPSPPGDEEVIFADRGDGQPYTWGEHRAMGATLDLMEADNPEVAAARAALDEKLIKAGCMKPVGPVILICEFCGKSEFVRHQEDCPDYHKDLPVTREAGGYQYLDNLFRSVHVTSVPMTDDEALEYFGIVQLMFPPGQNVEVRYIMRREMHENEWKMMPWYFDKDSWEVREIEQSG